MRQAAFYTKMAELAERQVAFVVSMITHAEGSTPRGVGAKMLVLGDGTTIDTIGGGVLEQQVIADALACLTAQCSASRRYDLRAEGDHALGALCGGQATVFHDVQLPDCTLLIVGAGHVGRKLCASAKALDYRVVVLDPRADMLTTDRFPEADELVLGDPGHVTELVPVAEETRVVVITHSHTLDKAALRALLGSSASYIGMMGSLNKVRSILAQLGDEGVPPQLLASVHAPIGLDIGAQTPAELALSIMAEIVAHRHGRSTTLGEALSGLVLEGASP